MIDVAMPSHVPASATAQGDGVVIGSGPVTVDAYIDFLCPFCRQFELNAGDALAGLVSAGQISLAYHPMNFLDAASSTNYSTRAAASSGCASDGGRFLEYAHAVFVSQPPEGGPGLTDAQLADLAVGAGLPAPAFAECVQSGRYLDWPPYVTAMATARGVQSTPTVLVNGMPVPGNARMITAAVAAVADG
jgi:protein-disulfide isomerase